MVGAGATGSAAAMHLARRGLRVALLDARPFSEAGARWVDYVPGWMFEAADVPLPEPPERTAAPAAMIMRAGDVSVRVDANPCLAVDMRALVARLQAAALSAGVSAFSAVRLHRIVCEGGRPVSAETSAGELRAPLFVDASGLNGAIRRHVPLLVQDCPAVGPGHLCSAAQEVRRISDPEAAARWQHDHGLSAQEILSRPGVAGGYSVMNVSVDAPCEHADLLTGCILGAGRSGPALIDETLRLHPFIGERLYGGAGTIPLRRPYDRLVAPGVALLGDAACQVFSAHGSGVGMGLLAAKLLAEAIETGADPGDERVLWRYAVAFQRRYGATLGVYDLFRRLTQRLDVNDYRQLLGLGLVTPRQLALGLEQVLPALGVGEVFGALRTARARPRLTAMAAMALAPTPAVVHMYHTYPDAPGPRKFRLWSRSVAALFGERPDVA